MKQLKYTAFGTTLFIVGAICLIISPSHSEARTKFGIMGSYGITKMRATVGSGTTSVVLGDTANSHNIGGGFIFDLAIAGPISFEIGALAQSRGYKAATSNDEIKFDAQTSTAIIRYHFEGKGTGGKVPLSGGIGAYYSAGQNNKVTLIDGTTGVATETTFDSSTLPLGAMTPYDSGVALSFAGDFPVGKSTAISFDIRYLVSTNQQLVDNTFVTATWHEVSTLVGLTFGF